MHPTEPGRVPILRTPSFSIRPADELFLAQAPLRLQETFEIPRPAASVWDDLTSENPFAWCRMLKRISWTSPPPFGVGTTKTAYLPGGLGHIEERYFRWEEGRQASFCGVSASTPMYRRLAENYLIEPVTDTSCRFTWTIAVELHPLARPAGPLTRALLRTLFTDTRRQYGIAAG